VFQKFLIVTQVLLAVIYSSAGISKLLPGFPNIIGPVWLIDELAKYELGLLGYFIAFSQAIVGILLFFPQLRLCATLMLLPMHLCITVVTISLGWQGTPYVNTLLLIMIFAILYDERKKLGVLLVSGETHLSRNNLFVYLSAFTLFWSFAIFLRYGT